MQLIRGTDILLYTGENAETVGNVLIGEPSADGKTFTLAIPKGDSHIWTDRKLSFFGRTFRTVGFPQEGIEENLPLCWHKKVRAEYAEITGKCTFYEKDTFTRHVFGDVFLHDGRGVKTSKTGDLPSDCVSVRIYSFAHDGGYIPKAGDIAVNGECSFEFDTGSERAVSESMARFRAEYSGYFVAGAVQCTVNGLLPDITVTGK